MDAIINFSLQARVNQQAEPAHRSTLFHHKPVVSTWRGQMKTLQQNRSMWSSSIIWLATYTRLLSHSPTDAQKAQSWNTGGNERCKKWYMVGPFNVKVYGGKIGVLRCQVYRLVFSMDVTRWQHRRIHQLAKSARNIWMICHLSSVSLVPMNRWCCFSPTSWPSLDDQSDDTWLAVKANVFSAW